MIKYIDIYKKKIKNSGSNMAESISNSTIYLNNKMFKEDISYREAYLNLDKKQKIDTRFRESKSDQFTKYFLTRPNEKITLGSYITTKDGTFLVVESSMDNIFPKVGTLVCNQIFRCHGLKDMPCNANNTTYGVKGLKDNGTFKEPDAKLKIIIQANDYTCKYQVGMRVLFKDKSEFISNEKNREWIAYKVLKKDYIVLENQYVMELELSTLLIGLDDLVNGVAYNPMLNSNENKTENKFNIDGIEDLKIDEVGECRIENTTNERAAFRVNDTSIARIVEQDFKGKCKIKGLKEGYVNLEVVVGNKLMGNKWILIY